MKVADTQQTLFSLTQEDPSLFVRISVTAARHTEADEQEEHEDLIYSGLASLAAVNPQHSGLSVTSCFWGPKRKR